MKSPPKIPVAILVRVSTAKQDTERQIAELKKYASQKGYDVVNVCEELGVSGRAEESERHGLRQAEALAVAGKVKKVLVHEISRLARKNSVVHKFVETLEEHGVSLYWHAQGFETILENGRRNPCAGIMLAVLAESARAEVDTLRERIISGLAQAKKNGKILGRRKGSTLSKTEFLDRHKNIQKLLKDGLSIRQIAKVTEKGISTVQRVKLALSQ